MAKANKKVRKKYSIKDLIHRTKKLDLHQDVVMDGKIEEIVVGWVSVMGQSNPKYLLKGIEYTAAYHSKINSDSSTEEILEATTLYQNQSLVGCILDWDEDFFGGKFSEEAAIEIFNDENYITYFNEISRGIQKGIDFLPIVESLV